MTQPIAIFDSGVGGLSVVRAIRARLPGQSLVYLGDTARVPYGIKSPAAVRRFALEDFAFLMQFEPQVVVVACNTATAAALEVLRRVSPVPVVGVIEPGARAAAACPGVLGLVATETTVASGAYDAAFARLAPGRPFYKRACPLWVPLVEEGRTSDDPIVRAVVAEYLAPLARLGVRSLVLGCTHYPLLREAIEAFLGPAVRVVDSAEATAEDVAALVAGPTWSARPERRFFVTDNPSRFRTIGMRFLEDDLGDVEEIDLADFRLPRTWKRLAA